MSNTLSKYQQIAVDIASKIAAGYYEIGSKIYTRTAIASQYEVSSETARRAIAILAEKKIVETEKGSGVVIKSAQRAAEFLKQHYQVRSVAGLKNDLIAALKQYNAAEDVLKSKILELIEMTEKMHAATLFVPYEIQIDEACVYIGCSIGEINFWNRTMATIVGIQKKDCLVVSPGPYAQLEDGDIVYYVGDGQAQRRVTRFLYEGKSE